MYQPTRKKQQLISSKKTKTMIYHIIKADTK